MVSWSSRKKKEGIFCTFYIVRRKLFQQLRFISMYSVFNKLSEYKYFSYQKALLHTLFCLFLKSSKAISISLNVCGGAVFDNAKQVPAAEYCQRELHLRCCRCSKSSTVLSIVKDIINQIFNFAIWSNKNIKPNIDG